MAISQDLHNAVLLVTTAKHGDAVNFGFKEIADAIYFVSEQITDEAAKKDYIVDALSDGAEWEGITYQILDIESYLDIYEGDDDDE